MEDLLAKEYLEKIGWGRYQIKVFLQCGFAWFCDMLWSSSVTFILQGTKKEFNLSHLEQGLLGSCFPLGLVIGGSTFGIIADRFGRMRAFKSSVVISAFSCLTLLFSFNFSMTVFSLIVLGAGMGGEIGVGGTVFCEFCPPSKLYYLTSMALFWSLGGIFSALIALVTTLTNITSIPTWRIVVASACVLEIICLVLRFFMVETPAYCFRVRNYEKAERVLNKISMENLSRPFVFDRDISSDLKLNSSVVEEEEVKISTFGLIMKLFSKRFLRMTIGFIIIYALVCFAFTSTLYFMPELLGSMSAEEMYEIILIQQVCGIPGILLGTKLVETRLGRKYTTCLFFGLAGVCCFIFYISQNIYSVSLMQMTFATSILSLSSLGGYSSLYTITPESYITEIRNIGCAFANVFARTAAVIAPTITGIVLTIDGGLQIIVSVYILAYAISSVACLLLKETRSNLRKEMLL